MLVFLALFLFELATGQQACSYPCDATTSARSFGTNGGNLLAHFEGFSSTCYKDSEGIWTIGIGHACLSSATDLPQYGVTCRAGTCSGSLTYAQALSVLNSDLTSFVSCVNNAVRVPLTQNQFDALVSFAFNVGCGGFQTSTLLSMLNGGNLTDAASQFQLSRWHSGCTAGLMRRRYTESQLFSTCASNFACTTSDCSLSYGYTTCHSGCQYCSACSSCNGDSTSMPTCLNGAGGGCDVSGCQNCVKFGGGVACATGSCAGCSSTCLNCITGGGGTACVDRCVSR